MDMFTNFLQKTMLTNSPNYSALWALALTCISWWRIKDIKQLSEGHEVGWLRWDLNSVLSDLT